MEKTRPTRTKPTNHLLSRLPREVYESLAPHLQPVVLEFKQVLYQAKSPIRHVYFPYSGTASYLNVMLTGQAIEVATVGNEGMVGVDAFLGPVASPNQVIVQIAGDGLRMTVQRFQEHAAHDGPLRRRLIQYQTVFFAQVSQSVACNGLHSIQQRCCRWLLMTRDRVDSDKMLLTHEYLAIMLGVRRASVSDVLNPLREQGLLQYTRGKIRILDRKGLEAVCCECYRVVKDEFERAPLV